MVKYFIVKEIDKDGNSLKKTTVFTNNIINITTEFERSPTYDYCLKINMTGEFTLRIRNTKEVCSKIFDKIMDGMAPSPSINEFFVYEFITIQEKE